MARLLYDPIHGNVELSDDEWKIINTACFQRLRQLKQLGMAHLTYPNATHTRFAHSVGVVATMSRILNAVQRQDKRIKPQDVQDLRLAALLHDIGHYPYSHLMERADTVVLTEDRIAVRTVNAPKRTLDAQRTTYPDHEEVANLIITQQPELVKTLGGERRAQRIADLLRGLPVSKNAKLENLIHSSFDMDRIDYLLRDAHATGVPFGQIDIHYLLDHVRLSPKGNVGIERKALTAVEHFVLARFFMHKAVYYHKTTYGFEECCRQLLRRAQKANLYDVPADGEAVRKIFMGETLAGFNDAWLDEVIRRATQDGDLVIRSLAKAIHHRRAPCLIREVPVLARADVEHHASNNFVRNCSFQLEGVAKRYGLPLECFLVCELKPLRFEQRSRLMTRNQAERLRPGEQSEVIRVFNEGSEPVDVVDVRASILSGLSNFTYQTSRLYLVVPDGMVLADEKIDELRNTARQWNN